MIKNSADNATNINDKTKQQKARELERLIEMGANGFFPLFYPEWINNSLAQKRANSSYVKSREKINKVYETISRHRNIDRQRTALMGMTEEDRMDFVQSFLHLVENQVIDNSTRLH